MIMVRYNCNSTLTISDGRKGYIASILDRDGVVCHSCQPIDLHPSHKDKVSLLSGDILDTAPKWPQTDFTLRHCPVSSQIKSSVCHSLPITPHGCRSMRRR